jgi:L-gulonolactone oxidase
MPTLTNWNHEIRFDVADEQFKTPTQVSDVQAIVRQAFEANQPVTVVGALHSTTECMIGAGIVIVMKNMDHILSVNPEGLTVTVEAGVSLYQLCSYLKEIGLQPPVILEFGNFQIGAISGTHANDTSIKQAAQFSSFVLGVKLVTPAGDVMEISETQNTEYLPAIRSHFGMFGVVCAVTLRVFKNQPLRLNVKTTEIDTFIAGFSEELWTLKADSDQLSGMLFPHTSKLLWQCRKFVDPVTPNLVSPETPVIDRGINLFKDVVVPLVKAGAAGNSGPALTDLLSAAVFEWPTGIFYHVSYVINPCNRGVVYSAHDTSFEFYEWMFPEHNWCDMIRAFLQLCDRFRRERDFILALPVLIYFLRQDEASLLSRSRHGDMIGIDPTYPDQTDGTWKAFRLVFNQIAVLHGGIPHINKTRDGTISHFVKAHDPDIIRLYLQKRKQIDPKDLFLNDFFKTMFADYL